MVWQGAVGEIAVAFSGNIINSEALLEEMKNRGKAFYHGLDIEIISKLIMQEKNVVTGISMLAKKIKGAYSLVVLTQDGIYAARDIYGFRPLMLGEGFRAQVSIAQETCDQGRLCLSVKKASRPGKN
jgi:amidophosphoribosyltransferase